MPNIWLHKIVPDWPQLSDFCFLFSFVGDGSRAMLSAVALLSQAVGQSCSQHRLTSLLLTQSENDRQRFILSTDIPTGEEVCFRAAIAYEVARRDVWERAWQGWEAVIRLPAEFFLTWCPAWSEKARADSPGRSTGRDEDSPLRGHHWQTGSLSAMSLVMDWKLKSPQQGVKTSVCLSLQSRNSQAAKDKPSALPALIRSCTLTTCWLSKAGECTVNGFPLEFP